jgi:hypothetical protein
MAMRATQPFRDVFDAEGQSSSPARNAIAGMARSYPFLCAGASRPAR